MKPLPVLVALLLAISAPPALAGRDVLRQQSARTVEPAGLRGVRAENSRGDVQVGASADGKVHVSALKVVRSGSRAESERMAAEIRVEVTQEAGELVVRARYPTQRSIRVSFWDLLNDYQVPSTEVRIGLELPPGLPLSVRTSSGDVDTEGVSGTQRIETSSGDVQVERAGSEAQVVTTSGDVSATDVARVRVRTVSGDVELVGVRGPLDAHTTSGDLTVHDAADSLLLGTVSGDVEIEGASRGLDLTTTNGEVKVRRVHGVVSIGASSGNVTISAVAPLTSIAVTTGSGDIELNLDRGVGAKLELQTSNGTLQMDEPIQVQSMTRRRVTGQLRQGNAWVRLRSASGDIHVTTGEQGS